MGRNKLENARRGAAESLNAGISALVARAGMPWVTLTVFRWRIDRRLTY